MSQRRPVGGGRRGGSANGSVGGRRESGVGGRRESGGSSRDGGGGMRDGVDGRRDGVGSSRDGGRGRRDNAGGRRDGVGNNRDGGGGMRDGGGGHNSSGGRRQGNSSDGGTRTSCSSGNDMRSDVRSNKSLDVGGFSASHGRGGKSVRGGSGSCGGGSSYAGGSSRVGNSVGGGRPGEAYEHHFTDAFYDASSEDSDYEDEFDDDEDDGCDEDEVEQDSEDEGHEDSEEEGHEVEGNDQEDSEDDDQVAAEHNRRGYSLGLFGNPPPQPIAIRMAGRVVDSPVACRTLLAIMRVYWPPGCLGIKDVDRRFPRWWSRIRKMFSAYFKFDPKHGTKHDAREALNRHMRRNMRKPLCNERRRIKKIIKEKGGSFLDYRPPYFSEAVWKPICDHWDSPKFQKKSDAAKEAREHQKIPHTSGAISFQRRAWDIRDETGKEAKFYDLFIRLHTKDKENKEFTSEDVRKIVEQYLTKCGEHNEDPMEAPINTWVEVVGVRKNSIIGIPRASASELIPLPPESGKRHRRRSVDDASGASTGRSAVERMADDLVMQAVDRTVAFARAHPDQFDLAPEQVNILAQSVEEGVSDLPSDHPITMTTMRELVQAMVSVLSDVYESNPTTRNCKKGKTIAREDEHHSDDDVNGDQSGRSQSGKRSGSLWIRGD